MTALGKADFAISTFFAASHPNDKCGANGLPLTPNSIKILGNFRYLQSIDHPYLCKYLDITRGKHERLNVVSEYYRQSVASRIHNGQPYSEAELLQLAYEVLSALAHLNSKNIVHRNLSPENILYNHQGKVKLTKYGMYFMTDYGANVTFPIGEVRYHSPDVLVQGPVQVDENTGFPIQPPSGPKADVWSLAIILLEALMGQKLWPGLSLAQIIRKNLGFALKDCKCLDILEKEDTKLLTVLKGLSVDCRIFLEQCLTVSSKSRPSPKELLGHAVFTEHRLKEIPYKNGFHQLLSTTLRCKDLELPTYDEDGFVKDLDNDHLGHRTMEEVYYLWQLAGGDLDASLRKADLVKPKPPVKLIPRYVAEEGEVFGQRRDRCELLDNLDIVLSQKELRQRLQYMDDAAYYPLLEDETSSPIGLPASPSSMDLTETATLPLVIKEKDIEYQFHRIILYSRLLLGYPYKRAHIWKEARVDIPPLVRPHVWAALLEVEGDVQGRYDSIDKETPIATDRQIEVDIPRCHQYHELLSSPAAHNRFKRILKAWVVSHPKYVYWQGLDSLCAPFLALNFNNEAMAFSCLQAFIPKYLHKFFLKDNSPVIQEYLAVFSHLIAFHDPELSNHLEGIGFIPDLYAIPWFLTMYAHVFPLHKIMHLWDTLLLGNSSFPLCIGVAILQQLRARLLTYGFNECILLFSDMPGVDIETVVQDSIKIFCGTPKSATYRQHARPLKRLGDKKESRPNVSYYSRDYHDLPNTELSMEPLSLDEMKVAKCPRISAEDLIELSELAGTSPTRSPTKRTQSSKPKIVMIDIRTPDEFKRGIIPGSINIPFHTAFNPEGDLVSSSSVQMLNSLRQQVKVVIGNRGKNAVNFANELVRLCYAKICILHKGIDVMRTTGLLTVPPADI